MGGGAGNLGGFGGARPGSGGFGGFPGASGGLGGELGRMPSDLGRPGGGFGDAGLGRGGAGQFGGGQFGAGGLEAGGLEAGGLGARGLGTQGWGAQGLGSDRFNTPNRSQLNSFLGLPSDEGLHSLSGNRPFSGDNFDVNYGTKEGPRGGQAAGISVTGPQGNTAGRAVGVGAEGGVGTVAGVKGAGGGAAVRGAAVGPEGGAVAGGAVRGPEGGAAARGVAVGPRGGVAAGGAVRGPEGGAAARGIAVGPAGGVAAGFARVTPSGRYTAAVAVRGNYAHWGIYGRGWYTAHPGAWFAAGWAADAIWRTCTWATAAAYCGYAELPPVYYDYGNNVVYEDNSVYVNGDSVGTAEEYYGQAASLAQTGATANAPADGDWMPLGVFALAKPDQTKSDVTIQLAVNKQGVVRGNYTDTETDKTQLVQGSVDKQTQRVAFTVGDNTTNVVETGLYNLTKDEAPCLLHFGKDRTEQWLLVRLQKPADAGASAT